MLESIPGVSLLSVQTEPFGMDDSDDAPVQPPLDDLTGIDELNEEPEPGLPPELAEELMEIQRKTMFDWTRRPNPTFGGLTPREACDTDAGVRTVKFMIRTRPLMHPDLPNDLIEKCRRELFEDLGLSD